MTTPAIVLASASRYRAELLRRLGIDFSVEPADVDETPDHHEPAATLALRLAQAKAGSVAARHADCLVIGSDQVAELDGSILGKPGDAATAESQLIRASERTVRFHTALVVLQAQQETSHVDLTTVRFRRLDQSEIGRYIEREQPFDCAGSFRCEGLGICLFEHIESRDPTALIGLPLISLCRMLRGHGLALP